MDSSNVSVEAGAISGAVGDAFSVPDGLLALRWAEIVRARGYRLTFSHAFVEAEEALEIWHPSRKRAVATVFRGVNWVWVIDGAGSISAFADLARALRSLVTLSRAEQHALTSVRPFVWSSQACPTRPTGRVRRLIGGLARLPAVSRRAVSGHVAALRLAWERRRA